MAKAKGPIMKDERQELIDAFDEQTSLAGTYLKDGALHTCAERLHELADRISEYAHGRDAMVECLAREF